MGSDDKKVRNAAISLLKDKTIFLYNFCKLNGTPVRTRWTQDIVLSDNSKRVLFCACNQHLGKSTTLDFDAATDFLMDHGKRWVGLLISGSLSQSQERMSNIKLLLDSMEHISYKIKEIDDETTKGKSNATQLSIFFHDEITKKPLYSNLLICCPHTSSALGYPADVIFLDEVDFWEDVKGGQINFYNQVLDPRTYFTKGKIKGYSNPNGKDRMMWFLWNQKKNDGTNFWHRYHFNYWDKPEPTQEEFEDSCIGKTKNQIESTLLASFTTTEGSFFSKEEIDDILSDQSLIEKGDNAGYGRETAWFLDVGSVHDQSVLIGAYLEDNEKEPEIPLIKIFWIHKYPVGYPIGRVVGIKSAIAEDGWEDYEEDNPTIKTVLQEYSQEENGKIFQPLFGFDATGNAGMKPLLEVAMIEAISVTFTGKLKWALYQRLQYYVQQRFIKRVKERDENTVRGCDFNHQLRKLVVKKNTQTSYKQIHHESESDLDDCADTLAGLIQLIEDPENPSLSFDIIEMKNKDVEEIQRTVEEQYIPEYVDKEELNNWMLTRKELT